jgi:hypothetical protein
MSEVNRMQVVINISEHNKSVLERYMDGTGYNRLPIPVTNAILEAVNSGKVLPKGHGMLKDTDKIINDGINKGFCDWYDEIKYAPTIIEADRSVEE